MTPIAMAIGPSLPIAFPFAVSSFSATDLKQLAKNTMLMSVYRVSLSLCLSFSLSPGPVTTPVESITLTTTAQIPVIISLYYSVVIEINGQLIWSVRQDSIGIDDALFLTSIHIYNSIISTVTQWFQIESEFILNYNLIRIKNSNTGAMANEKIDKLASHWTRQWWMAIGLESVRFLMTLS